MNDIARARFLYRLYLYASLAVLMAFCLALNIHPHWQNYISLSMMAALPALLGFFAAYHCGVYRGLTGKKLWL